MEIIHFYIFRFASDKQKEKMAKNSKKIIIKTSEIIYYKIYGRLLDPPYYMPKGISSSNKKEFAQIYIN